MGSSRENERHFSPRVGLGVVLGLVLAVAAVYAQLAGHAFVSYDDDQAITTNPGVQLGLSPAGIAWSFRTAYFANWIPLTNISLQADQSLHGLTPGFMLLENAALHAIATCFLFYVFWRMTKALWPSAAIAAVFALHPLHVESVAWAALRKDSLSGVFFVLCLWAHVRYAERPTRARLASVALACAAGLMAKPTLVTLPFVLLLLDYWPLRRMVREDGQLDARRVRTALVEKIPLVLLALAASIATVWAQGAGGAIVERSTVPLGLRVSNAIVSYVDYLRMSFWPSGLAAYYPPPVHGIPAWKVVLCVLLLLGVTVLAIRNRARRPWLLVGWLWFVGMLVPTIGLVQVGSQARADRYMYLPLIGLSILPIWAVAEWTAARPVERRALPAIAAVIFAALGVSAHRQVSYWKDGVTLFERVQAVTPPSLIAHVQLGKALLEEGRAAEAAREMRAAIALKPDYVELLNNLAWLLTSRPDVPALDPGEPMRLVSRAIELSNSQNPYPLYTLAMMHARDGRFAEAAESASRAATLARGMGNVGLAAELDARVAAFRAGRKP
jgi:hypothetical protein